VADLLPEAALKRINRRGVLLLSAWALVVKSDESDGISQRRKVERLPVGETNDENSSGRDESPIELAKIFNVAHFFQSPGSNHALPENVMELVLDENGDLGECQKIRTRTSTASCGPDGQPHS
jgi:hypothetical protein